MAANTYLVEVIEKRSPVLAAAEALFAGGATIAFLDSAGVDEAVAEVVDEGIEEVEQCYEEEVEPAVDFTCGRLVPDLC